jgi:hypothetical protein
LPPRPDLGHLKRQAKRLVHAQRCGDPSACATLRLLRRFADASDAEVLASPLALNEAQFALALDYGFRSWTDLKRHVVGGRPVRLHGTLRREQGRAVIEGLEAFNWGGPFHLRQESFMSALAAVLQAIGEDVSYDELMGLSGAAFKLLVRQPDFHPRAASCGVGFDCPEVALDAVGRWADWPELDGEDTAPEALAGAREAVVDSVDRGVPVLRLAGDFSIVVGYADAGATLIVREYRPAGEPGYQEVTSVPWALAILSDRHEPMPRREAVLRSLRIALELAHTARVDTESATYACGLAAYEAWIDGLARASGDAPDTALHGNALGYTILSSARGAAARYLRSVADELAGEAAVHIGHAAVAYGRINGLLQTGRACMAQPWRESWTAGNRNAQAELLAHALELEREALADLAEGVALIDMQKGRMADRNAT